MLLTDVMMAKLLQFTDRDFDQFENREESRKIKLVLYKREFQEGILALRKKYRIFNFPVSQGEPLKSLRKIPRNILLKAEKDARLICFKNGLDVGAWLTFILVLTFYNRLTHVRTPRGLHIPTDEEIEKQMQRYGMREHVTPEDVTSAYSEINLYESDTLQAQTKDGEIVLRISPQSLMTEVRSVLPAVKKCLRFLREHEHATERHDLLDVMNDAQYLSKERGLDATQILSTIKREYEDRLMAQGTEPNEARAKAKSKYRFSAAYIRKLLERARELGF